MNLCYIVPYKLIINVLKNGTHIKLHIEKLPEGVYLATSDDIQGLVAQGDTVAETERENMMSLKQIPDMFDYLLVVNH